MEEQKKNVALVTGASSGIGRAICIRLLALGYEVYGIGRSFSESTAPAERSSSGAGEGGLAGLSASGRDDFSELPPFRLCESDHFHPVVWDLQDTKKLPALVKSLQAEWKQAGWRFTLLVNNAGTAYYGLHEELRAEHISEMVRVNLEVPMILTQQLLRVLKKNHGSIVNISSVTALSSNPHGVAYGATKAGLLSFSRSLFDEARKYGVRVTTILPDMTDTRLYRHADFQADPALDAHLEPEDVVDALVYALTTREGSCVPEIVLRPQLHRIQKKAPKS